MTDQLPSKLTQEWIDKVMSQQDDDSPSVIGAEISAGIRHDWPDHEYTLPERDLLALTALLDEHPEWWDHPCLCAECRTHG